MLIFKAHAKPITAVAFSPSGTLLATASGTERLVRLWQLGSDKPKKLHEWPMHFPSSVAFSPDSRIVAAGSLRELGAWNLDGTAIIADKASAPKLCISSKGVLYAHGMVSTRRRLARPARSSSGTSPTELR